MYFLVLLIAAAVSAKNGPPPPPDRIWFRQDSLPRGQTCASLYEKVKGTAAVIQGPDPIILPSDATFKICIKFLDGKYTNPQNGEVTHRKGRDWSHDSGRKSTCTEGCCEFLSGRLAKKYLSWFPTSSDCSNTKAAKDAPLYFTAKVSLLTWYQQICNIRIFQSGASVKLCAFLPEKAGKAPVWQLLKGTATRCVDQCCTIKRN